MNTIPLKTSVAVNPPKWTEAIPEKALSDMKMVFIDGDIASFYESWSPESKQSSTFIDFGKKITGFEQVYGRFDRFEGTGPLRESTFNPNIFGLDVRAFVGEEEFSCIVAYTEQMNVSFFMMMRTCIYHKPEYVREARFERIEMTKDPRFIFCRPTKAGASYPAIFPLTTAMQMDCDGKMGYCFIYRDYEYLASANIALLRGEYSEEMLDTGDPIPFYAGQAMQLLMSRRDVKKIFIMMEGYSSLFLPKILRKFSGIIAGVVLINPAFHKYPDSPMEDFDANKVEKDLPILLIQSAFDIVVPEEDAAKWKEIIPQFTNAKTIFYDKMDHSLMPTDHKFIPQEYAIREHHVSDVALRDIATWVRSQ